MSADENELPVEQILNLKLTTQPWQLTIDGNVENLNLAMAMLTEALRTMEMQLRIGAAKEQQALQQKEVMDNHRVQEILKRTKIHQ